MTRLLAHLPCYRLADADEQRLGEGRLRQLTFDEWQAFDSSFPRSDNQYRHSQPLFYEVEGTAGDLPEFRSRVREQVHFAVMCRGPNSPDLALPPEFSITYEVDGDVTRSLTGALEEYPLVWGVDPYYPIIRLSAEDVAAAEKRLAMIGFMRAVPQLRRLLDTVAATARPEIDGAAALILSIAALEDVLIGAPVGKLRQTFANRVAGAMASWELDVDRWRNHASFLYGLRSDIVHGNTGPAWLAEKGLDSLRQLNGALGRNLVHQMAFRLGRAGQRGLDLAELGPTLDRAASDPAALLQFDLLARRRPGG